MAGRKKSRGTPDGSAITLVIDIGGTHVKLYTSRRTTGTKFPSGPKMTPSEFLTRFRKQTHYWRYGRVSIGYPGPVFHGRPVANPPNLGKGWTGFQFGRALRRPVRIVNDAVLQAIGAYRGGRMLFLGFGTGLGTALIVDGRVEAMEIGHLPFRKGRSYEDYVGERGLLRLGKRRWRRKVFTVIEEFRAALEPEYVVVGGGNAALLRQLPPKTARVDNRAGFTGGLRLWETEIGGGHLDLGRPSSGSPRA
ncbi:MAG TPA: ROK family protein [Thermoplasmata archaeon]|nr:ROK family protein [Thermoplasmata archaeon]